MPNSPTIPQVPDGSHLLAEAAPNSLDELFSRDPLQLTQQDLRTIVQKLRADREKWARDEAAGKKRASSGAAGAPSKKKVLTLDDLDLDL